jgi:hypothetical protein
MSKNIFRYLTPSPKTEVGRRVTLRDRHICNARNAPRCGDVLRKKLTGSLLYETWNSFIHYVFLTQVLWSVLYSFLPESGKIQSCGSHFRRAMEQLVSDITNHIFTPVSYLHGQFCKESELYADSLYSAQKSTLTGRVENVYNFL